MKRNAATWMQATSALPVRALEKTKVLCVFAEKGGVGKTTHSYNIASVLASLGFKVLLCDADPQCSLSQLVLQNDINAPPYDGDYLKYLQRPLRSDAETREPRTLYDAIKGIRAAQLSPVEKAHSIYLNWSSKWSEQGGGLWLLPGHTNLSEFDGYIAAAESTMQAFPQNSNVSGAPYYGIMHAAENILRDGQSFVADFVILDLSPYPSALNRCLLMSSHYVIIPSIPDFFSTRGVQNFCDRLHGQWLRHIENIVIPQTSESMYPFPSHLPKVLGYIMGRFEVNKLGPIVDGLSTDMMARNTARWVREVEFVMQDEMQKLRALRQPLAMPTEKQNRLCLANIRSFNQLGALSQLFNRPVCFLEKAHMVRDNGAGQLQQMRNDDAKGQLAKVQDFYEQYLALVRYALELMQHPLPPSPTKRASQSASPANQKRSRKGAQSNE